MQEQNKNKLSVRGEFFWIIPGDVPAYRGQPDPYQSRRTVPDEEYQLPAHLDLQQPIKTISSVPVVMQLATSANASESRQSRAKKLLQNLAVFILLLFMPGIGAVGYHPSGTHSAADLNQMSGKLMPIAVAQAKPNNEPKTINLTLGKKTPISQTKLRVVTHVVVKGDTLWDISEVYVKNPFRYPELAKLSNIKDPDWIYPYDLVRIHIYE